MGVDNRVDPCDIGFSIRYAGPVGMDLDNLADIQQVAPAVHGFEEFAFDVDRAFHRERGGLQFPVERPEDAGLVLVPETRPQ